MQAQPNTPHCRDLVWLKNRAITKLTLAQIAKNESYRTRHNNPVGISYLSRRINGLAQRITHGVTEAGADQTAAYYHLTDVELSTILYYAFSLKRTKKGSDTHE